MHETDRCRGHRRNLSVKGLLKCDTLVEVVGDSGSGEVRLASTSLYSDTLS